MCRTELFENDLIILIWFIIFNWKLNKNYKQFLGKIEISFSVAKALYSRLKSLKTKVNSTMALLLKSWMDTNDDGSSSIIDCRTAFWHFFSSSTSGIGLLLNLGFPTYTLSSKHASVIYEFFSIFFLFIIFRNFPFIYRYSLNSLKWKFWTVFSYLIANQYEHIIYWNKTLMKVFNYIF